MARLINLQHLVGLGFETYEEFKNHFESMEEVTSVSDIIPPDNDISDEMIFLETNCGKGEYVLFIARGASGRFYIIEVC